MKVAVRVKELVDGRGWNVEEFARQAGVDAETAQSLYSGQTTEIELGALGRLSQALGVTPPDIVSDVTEKQLSAGQAPSPRAPEVPEQTMDEIKKSPPEPNAGG